MLRTALILLALLCGSGCYLAYPEIPKIPKPEVVEGEQISVKRLEKERMVSCEPGQRNCWLNSRGKWTRPKAYYTAQTTYNGRTLTQWELRQLVDPKFDEKLARVKSNKGTCNISLVPSVISVAGLAALTIAGPFYGQLGDAAIPVAIGASAAAVGGGLLSYPLGGFACRRAQRQFKEMFTGVSAMATEFELTQDDGSTRGSTRYINEVEALAKDFNARFGGSRSAKSSDDEDEDEDDDEDDEDDDE